jgi:hypothetical protein
MQKNKESFRKLKLNTSLARSEAKKIKRAFENLQAGEGWQDSVVPHRHLCTV